jgi:hypothetical protein
LTCNVCICMCAICHNCVHWWDWLHKFRWLGSLCQQLLLNFLGRSTLVRFHHHPCLVTIFTSSF